ncbi:MAG: hypothetical protein JWN98_530 [Abditibacteriota bacterium]|nr:hypothetical protein [Abditibacteriota bacterium]
MKSRSIKKLFTMLFKGAVALVISVALCEGLLRVFIAAPAPYEHNPRLGWLPKPNSYALSAWEGRAVCRYNELGFRDDTIEAPQAKQLRVLCLGDSYTEATQMPVEQTYPRRLQDSLRQAGLGPSTRVFNGGRNGTSPLMAVGLAKEYQAVFQPDWVVLLVRDQWSELLDSTHEFYAKPAGNGFEMKHRWHWDAMSPRMRQIHNLGLRNSALLQYGKFRLDLMIHFAKVNAQARQTEEAAGKSQESKPTSTQQLFERRIIDWTIQGLRRSYPRLVIVHIPYGSPGTRTGLAPPTPAEKFLRESCLRAGVPCLFMRPVLNEDFARSQQPSIGFDNTLPWHGHPNGRAHGLIARTLHSFFTTRSPQTQDALSALARVASRER